MESTNFDDADFNVFELASKPRPTPTYEPIVSEEELQIDTSESKPYLMNED